MTIRNALAFSFAAALLSVSVVGVADAASTHRRMAHNPSHHTMNSSRASQRAMPTGADHSADSLNAQSLDRTRGGQ